MTYLRGIVLNGAIGAENLNYPANDKVKYLLGASFQPIRAEFWNSPQHLIVSEIQNIFITVGGNDIHDILPLIVGLACKNFPNAIVRIICGKNHNTKRWVEQQQNKNITAHFNISAAEMQYLMKSSDIAISAAGQTLYELAATGLPTIAFSVANNQITNLEGWTQAGFVLNAGICTDSDFLKKLKSSIEKFKSAENRMISSINGQRIISKKGSCNAVNATLSIHCIQHMLLRKANPSDVDEIFNLSNDVAVRENSFNQEKILYSDHVAWFQKKINNPNSLLLVANISNTFAGQIRYEITNECAIISISIDKKFRGIGLGEKLIKESKNNLIAQYPSVKFIIAQIRKENHASVNMFLKAGFNFYKEEEYLEYHLII
jgi:UDP-2,4-diacetamido-2,4,6-trideoxy-beta-L-altropyranose hydrolase